MTRVIAGSRAGRRLAVPRGPVRPSTARVRGALLTSLDAHGRIAGAVVLDLFAGSGALGIEALSRGAARAVLVDASAPACTAIRANLDALGLAGEVVRANLLGAAGLAGSGSAGSGSAGSGAAGSAGSGAAGSAGSGRADRALPAGLTGLAADLVLCDPPYATPAKAIGDLLADLAAVAAIAPGATVALERPTRDPWQWPEGFHEEWDRRHGDTRLRFARRVDAP